MAHAVVLAYHHVQQSDLFEYLQGMKGDCPPTELSEVTFFFFIFKFGT